MSVDTDMSSTLSNHELKAQVNSIYNGIPLVDEKDLYVNSASQNVHMAKEAVKHTEDDDDTYSSTSISLNLVFMCSFILLLGSALSCSTTPLIGSIRPYQLTTSVLGLTCTHCHIHPYFIFALGFVSIVSGVLIARKYNKLRNVFSKYTASMLQCCNTIFALESSLKNVSNTNTMYMRAMQKLKEIADGILFENMMLQGKYDTLKTEYGYYKATNKTTEKEVIIDTSSSDQLQLQYVALQEKYANLKEKYAVMEELGKSGKDEVRTLQEKHNAISDKYNSISEQILVLQAEKKSLQEEVHDLQVTKKDSHDKLEHVRSEKSIVEVECKEYHVLHKQNQSTIVDLKEHSKTLQSQVEEAREYVKKLEKEYAMNIGKSDSVNNVIENLQKQLEELRMQKETFEKQNHTLQQANHLMSTQLQVLELKYQHSVESVTQVKEELQESAESEERLQERVYQLSSDVAVLKKTLEQVQDEHMEKISLLRSEHKVAFETSKEEYNQRVEHISQELVQYQQMYNILNEKSSSLQMNYDTCLLQIQQYLSKINALETSLSNEKITNTELRRENEQNMQRQKQLMELVDSAHKRACDAEKQVLNVKREQSRDKIGRMLEKTPFNLSLHNNSNNMTLQQQQQQFLQAQDNKDMSMQMLNYSLQGNPLDVSIAMPKQQQQMPSKLREPKHLGNILDHTIPDMEHQDVSIMHIPQPQQEQGGPSATQQMHHNGMNMSYSISARQVQSQSINNALSQSMMTPMRHPKGVEMSSPIYNPVDYSYSENALKTQQLVGQVAQQAKRVLDETARFSKQDTTQDMLQTPKYNSNPAQRRSSSNGRNSLTGFATLNNHNVMGSPTDAQPKTPGTLGYTTNAYKTPTVTFPARTPLSLGITLDKDQGSPKTSSGDMYHRPEQNTINGCKITSVKPNTFADSIGFKHGDIILHVNNYRVECLSDFNNAKKQLQADTVVNFVLRRDKFIHTIPVSVVEKDGGIAIGHKYRMKTRLAEGTEQDTMPQED